MISKDEEVRVDLDGAPQDIGEMKIVDAIAELQRVLDGVPEAHRDAAMISICAYDWEGVECYYTRPPTNEERAEAEAIFADRAALIERTDIYKRTAWIRQIRIKYGVSRDEAEEMMRNDERVVTCHPLYDWKSKIVAD